MYDDNRDQNMELAKEFMIRATYGGAPDPEAICDLNFLRHFIAAVKATHDYPQRGWFIYTARRLPDGDVQQYHNWYSNNLPMSMQAAVAQFMQEDFFVSHRPAAVLHRKPDLMPDD
jgi:hypothetical protein